MDPHFKSELAEILDLKETEINSGLVLDESNWDSLSQVSTAALIDEVYSKVVDAESLSSCRTIDELMRLIDTC